MPGQRMKTDATAPAASERASFAFEHRPVKSSDVEAQMDKRITMEGTIRRILVVDDEVTFLKTVHRHLRRRGYVLETAQNGKSASRLIEERAQNGNPFDLVISDVVMPDMNGLELLGWIKAQYPEISVILLTGFGEGDAVGRAVRPKVDGFGSKPITPEKMLNLIGRISRHRETA